MNHLKSAATALAQAALTALCLAALWLTLQAFAPRLAALAGRTDHLPEVAMLVALVVGVIYILKQIFD